MAGMNWLVYRGLDLIKHRFGVEYKKSYSQCGEDLIIRFIFDALRIPAPTYLDIGAHHPSFINNTFIFYGNGSHGVNIEPDPSLITAFQEQRPRDTNLNIGISDKTGEIPFYVMSVRTLNTFSEEEARLVELDGNVKIERIISVPVRPVNEVMTENFLTPPDLISLDVEGLDLVILKSLDFLRFRPKVICVETITYSKDRSGRKISEIAEIMNDNNYFAYADTHINTLFVDRQVW